MEWLFNSRGSLTSDGAAGATGARATSSATVSASAPVPSSPLAQNPVIRNYEILNVIGHGAEATVYLARHQQSLELVALKKFHGPIDPSHHMEIQRTLHSLRHANIVPMREVFVAKDAFMCDSFYLVMEYCSRGSLQAFTKQLRGLRVHPRESWIMKWFIEVCMAVAYMHQQQIVHRDLKLDNLFLTKDFSVQVGDFGVARMFNVNGMQSLVGTLPYMAPEMLMQAQPYNEKVDMWSVYCCLFELTCPDKDLQELCSDVPGFGRIPVDEASAIQLGRVRQDTIRASIPAIYNDEFRSFITELFQVEPAKRLSAFDILQHPFVVRWQDELRIHPLGTSPITSWRPFQWRGEGPWVYLKSGDILQTDADVLVIPVDPLFECSTVITKALFRTNPAVKQAIADRHFKLEAKNIPGIGEPVYIAIRAPAPPVLASGVIFVVGPDYRASRELIVNQMCTLFKNCIVEAARHGHKSIAFPAIGTGTAGIQRIDCVTAFFQAIRTLDARASVPIESVSMVCYDTQIYQEFNDGFGPNVMLGPNIVADTHFLEPTDIGHTLNPLQLLWIDSNPDPKLISTIARRLPSLIVSLIPTLHDLRMWLERHEDTVLHLLSSRAPPPASSAPCAIPAVSSSSSSSSSSAPILSASESMSLSALWGAGATPSTADAVAATGRNGSEPNSRVTFDHAHRTLIDVPPPTPAATDTLSSSLASSFGSALSLSSSASAPLATSCSSPMSSPASQAPIVAGPSTATAPPSSNGLEDEFYLVPQLPSDEAAFLCSTIRLVCRCQSYVEGCELRDWIKQHPQWAALPVLLYCPNESLLRQLRYLHAPEHGFFVSKRWRVMAQFCLMQSMADPSVTQLLNEIYSL